MRFLDKLERKVGKYAISNLSLYLILCYGCGYLLTLINAAFLNYLTLDPYMILHGQVWRLFTWILVPPDSLDLFTLIMLYFYYSIGTSLERTWGTFYYNVYIFGGMISTAIGSFLVLGYVLLSGAGEYYDLQLLSQMLSYNFSTYYVNMSIFLAYAATFPNVQVLLMFILPIKMKWMGIAYAAILCIGFLQGSLIEKIVIIASIFNFVIFFWMTRKRMGMHMSPKQVKRRHDFNKEVKKAKPASVSKHKCAICGKTSEEYPDLEFRFCSKCNGNYEYCQDHLFTHTHVQ